MGNLFASKKANTYQSQPVIRNKLVQPVNRNDPTPKTERDNIMSE